MKDMKGMGDMKDIENMKRMDRMKATGNRDGMAKPMDITMPM
jgi:hypothetical protein